MDMVSLNIVGGILVSICRDMGVTLMRTSYSTIFSESLDFTCGLALPSGELVATGDFCPSMIGGMPLLLRSCVREMDMSALRPGDVIVHNDPYRGGLHTPEGGRALHPFHGQHLLYRGHRRPQPRWVRAFAAKAPEAVE